jgi:hypothetical protein
VQPVEPDAKAVTAVARLQMASWIDEVMIEQRCSAESLAGVHSIYIYHHRSSISPSLVTVRGPSGQLNLNRSPELIGRHNYAADITLFNFKRLVKSRGREI